MTTRNQPMGKMMQILRSKENNYFDFYMYKSRDACQHTFTAFILGHKPGCGNEFFF